ncbi:MAG: sulfatase [Deltaproteobacteria bacterium]|nr:sulfatase [Deltaproteobacteria bacterium]
MTLAACGSKKKTRDDAAPVAHDAATVAEVTDATATIDAPPPPPGRVEHAVWKLVDNRHAAHRFIGDELVLDAADIGFARYTRFGVPMPRWHYGMTVDGVRAATADKLAVVELPLTNGQAKTATHLTARVFGSTKQSLGLKVNGKKASKASELPLEDGWQTIAIPIDPGSLTVGENQLVLETHGKSKSKVSIAWLRIGSQPPGDLDPRASAVFDGAKDSVALAKDAGLTWFITVPDGGHLVADVTTPCKIEVRARASDDSFAGGNLIGEGARVDLTSMAGKVVALQLTARECATATITRPRITLHGPAPVPLPPSAPPRYIILWIMDALRADRIPIFTPGARAQTPNFDELAKTSAVFRQYYVQGNESQTSHSSMWTGLYPAVHNVRLAGVGGKWAIDNDFPVIATQLDAAGMFTTAVTGNGFVNDSGGYARGFKEFRNMMRETGVINGVIYGEKIVDAALGQLGKRRADPTYLFMGTIDTHGPWIARRPWIDIYSPGRYTGPFKDFGTAKDLGFKPGSMGCSIIPPKEDIDRLVAIYDSAISYQDKQLGRLIDQLKSWGIWDQTMLVITADHGEEFFEDKRCGHGGSLRDSLTRVPLLIHDPARFPGGTIVEAGAEGVDLLPTMLAALGAPAVDTVQGQALEPIAQGVGRGWPTPSYASMYEYAHAMRIGRWKARVGKAGVPIVGDMVEDPNETKDLSQSRPVERRMLTDNLGLFLALRTQWKKHAWGTVTNVTTAGAAALDGVTTP